MYYSVNDLKNKQGANPQRFQGGPTINSLLILNIY